MKKTLILTSVLILSGCIANNQTNTNPSMNNSKISIEQQNQKLFEFSKEFPDNVSFWKSCEDYNKSPDLLRNLLYGNEDLDKELFQAFNNVTTECRKFSARFGNNGIIRTDCNTCTSKEAELCANASRKYVTLMNQPFTDSQITDSYLTKLQIVNMDNYIEKIVSTFVKVKELCSGETIPESLKTETINKAKLGDKQSFEEYQKFKKQYEVAEEAQNADNCGIMPCYFIKQAAKSTPKAKEI